MCTRSYISHSFFAIFERTGVAEVGAYKLLGLFFPFFAERSPRASVTTLWRLFFFKATFTEEQTKRRV